MDRLGFIHEKLDIKLLILYVLKLLPAKVSFNELSDLVLIDGGFDYFEYSQCLSELVNSGHILQEDSFYSITEKGADHLEAVESRLPYSVRTKAERHARPTVQRMEREAMVSASHKLTEDGSCILKLSLADDGGELLKLRLLTSGEDQAAGMEKKFREKAEEIYLEIIRLLTPDKD